MASAEENRETIQRLLRSDDIVWVCEVLKGIQQFGPEWALPDITVGARDSSSPSRRAIFAWALSAYSNSHEALEVLLMLAKSDEDANVRGHAIEALGEFCRPSVVDLLLQLLDAGSPQDRWCI